MKSLKDFNLSDHPFQYLTPIPGQGDEDKVIWADMYDVSRKINGVYQNAINNPPRQVILNWGPWGGGKTFAAYYFIENFSSKINVFQAYIRSPKQGGKAADELFTSIIDFISFSIIKKQVKLLINRMGEENLFEFLNHKIRSEEYASAILLLGSEDKDVVSLMHRYVYSGLTSTELKQVGIPKNITTNTDSIKFLSGIILCFIGNQTDYKGKFVLWVDEMEDMIYYSQKEYRAFSQILRDLIDLLNQHFMIFLNFTLAEPEESTIELLLGGALWSRVNKKIRFRELKINDALVYCKELINHCQIDKSQKYMPFDEDTLNLIFELIPNKNLTPREINRYCGDVLNFAMESGADAISKELVSQCLEQIAEDK